jgi:hypothetical protein
MYDKKGFYLASLIITTIVNLAMGLLPLLDNYAHLGGFFSGFFVGLSLLIIPRVSPEGIPLKEKPYQWTLKVISFAIVIILAGIGIIMLYTKWNPTASCKWCSYLSCIPNPYFTCEVPTSTPSC